MHSMKLLPCDCLLNCLWMVQSQTGLHQPVFRFNESESTNSHQSGSSGVVINMPLQPPTRDESVIRTDSNNVIPFRRQPH